MRDSVDKRKAGEEMQCQDGVNCLSCKKKWQADNKTGCWEECSMIINGDVCPDCGAKLEHEGGCTICYNCGWAKCG